MSGRPKKILPHNLWRVPDHGSNRHRREQTPLTAMSGYTTHNRPMRALCQQQADLGATVFPGQPLMTIDDEGATTGNLLAGKYCHQGEARFAVQVTLDAIGRSFSARIAEIVPLPIRPVVPLTPKYPQPERLESGMFGRETISLGQRSRDHRAAEGSLSK